MPIWLFYDVKHTLHRDGEMREKRIARIYFRELFGAIALYAALLTAAIHFGKAMVPGRCAP
ncbi:MAG: hypothetical protein ABWY02_13755 [Telluria sp.]